MNKISSHILLLFFSISCSNEIVKIDLRDQFIGKYSGYEQTFSCFKDSGSPSLNYYTGIFAGGEKYIRNVTIEKYLDTQLVMIINNNNSYKLDFHMNPKDSYIFFLAPRGPNRIETHYLFISRDSIYDVQGREISGSNCSSQRTELKAIRQK